MKTGSPLFDSPGLASQMPAPMIPAPLQRTAVNRQQARRSYQGVSGRMPTSAQMMSRPSSFSTQSPSGQPTPPSHISSPTAMSNRSAASAQQGGIPSPASAVMSQGQSVAGAMPGQGSNPSSLTGSSQYQPSSAMSTISTASSRSASTARGNQVYGYSAPFQKQPETLGKYPCLSGFYGTMFVLDSF